VGNVDLRSWRAEVPSPPKTSPHQHLSVAKLLVTYPGRGPRYSSQTPGKRLWLERRLRGDSS
jgi:hypothetical protein